MRDPERTRAEILDVATTEFARVGYSGGRIDEIARLTSTTKRMIYYYFGSKEQLYVEVLHAAYRDIRERESELDLAGLDPVAALRRLTELTFDYHDEHPDFVRLVTVENVHEGRHLRQAPDLGGVNAHVLVVIDDVLRRGREAGLLRSDVTALDVHTTMSALCFHRVANRHSVAALFDYDMGSTEVRDRQRAIIVDVMVRWLALDDRRATGT